MTANYKYTLVPTLFGFKNSVCYIPDCRYLRKLRKKYEKINTKEYIFNVLKSYVRCIPTYLFKSR